MPSKNIPVNGWPQIKELDIVAPILAELDKIEAWQKSVKQETKTGAEVTFTNALALAAVSLSAEIEAEQDLHGYDHPWVGGAGKNKWNPAEYTEVAFNVTLTGDEYSTTYTDGRLILTTKSKQSFAAGQYVISAVGTNANRLHIFAYDASTDAAITNGASPLTINATAPFYIGIGGDGATSESPISVAFKVQIETGSTATTFAPYSNICPISGRTSVTITDVDAESQTATVTVQLGQTVYGGTLNVTTGVLTVDKVLETYNSSDGWSDRTDVLAGAFSLNVSTLYDNSSKSAVEDGTICNMYDVYGVGGYSGALIDRLNVYYGAGSDSRVIYIRPQGGTLTSLIELNTFLSQNPMQVCYELATPITIQLTPTDLQMLKGYNRLSADTGNITVTAYTGNKWN